MSGQGVPEAFLAAVEAAQRLGLKWSKDVDGCLEFDVPPYRVAVNGDTEPRKAYETECPGLGMCVERDGWPIAVINIGGGVFIGGGEPGEAEREFIEACARVQAPGEAD